jgi:hypothetical protein
MKMNFVENEKLFLCFIIYNIYNKLVLKHSYGLTQKTLYIEIYNFNLNV